MLFELDAMADIVKVNLDRVRSLMNVCGDSVWIRSYRM